MPRALLVVLLLALLPAGLDAQPSFLVGGGFSAPSGNVTDIADPGYHLQAGISVALPAVPVSLRGDGRYHRMGAAVSGLTTTTILGGAASLVFHLPGMGLQPYLLGGIGSYRTEFGPADTPEIDTDVGYHGGFGVDVIGFGLVGFAEIRYVRIDGATGTRLIPVTLGFRF